MLCTRPDHNKREFPDRIRLSKEAGVLGDFEMEKPWLQKDDGSADPRIQVSLLPLRVLDLIWRDRENIIFPGDTVIADFDMTESNLPAGARIHIGSAVLEASDIWNNGCAKWRSRYGRDAYDWVRADQHKPYRLRGVLCSIVKDGEVSIGDMISPDHNPDHNC